MGFPGCLIEIHGPDRSFELVAGPTPDRPFGESATGDLIECRIEKRKNADTPSGVFDIQLVRSKDEAGLTWADKIHPQDVVVIQMMNLQNSSGPNGAGEMHTVMIGLVDSVNTATTLTARGVPQRVIQVKGSDFGKIFKTGIVTYWNFLGASLLENIGQLQNFIPNAMSLNTQPDRIANKLITELFQRFMDIKFTVHQHQFSVFDILAQQLESYGQEVPAGADIQFLNGEGNFWSFFMKIASPPFHELWVDTRRSNTVVTTNQDPLFTTIHLANKTLGLDHSCPTLIMRKTPFPYLLSDGTTLNADRWNDLRKTAHALGDDDLIGEPFDDVMSVSDEEQYNFYLVLAHYPWIPERPWLLSVPGIIDAARFHRYGYKPMMPYTSMLHAPEMDSSYDPMGIFYTSLNWRIASWNVLNDLFASGYKTCKLLPHVHVGDIVIDQSSWQEQPKEYYVESIIHHFVYNQRATTTLGLTRGLTTQQYNTLDAVINQQGLQSIPQGSVMDTYHKLTGVS